MAPGSETRMQPSGASDRRHEMGPRKQGPGRSHGLQDRQKGTTRGSSRAGAGPGRCSSFSC
eukprot:4290163-Pyramimonas_sp.AAC.1